MARDIPRRHLLVDEVLVTLASQPALDAESLEKIEGLSTRARARYGKAILNCIDAARARGPAAIDTPVNLRPHAGTLSRLKAVVQHEADALRLPPELLASRRALEALVVGVVTNARRRSAGVSRLAIRCRHAELARLSPRLELSASPGLRRPFAPRS